MQHGQRGGSTYALARSLRPPAGLRLTPRELDDLVERLADDGPITNSDVRRATGLDRVDSLAILDRLVSDGRLVRTGAEAWDAISPAAMMIERALVLAITTFDRRVRRAADAGGILLTSGLGPGQRVSNE